MQARAASPQPAPGGNIQVGIPFGGGSFTLSEGSMLSMVGHGREYVEGTFARLINLRSLRRYFAVSTTYVLRKLRLLLAPYLHKGSWQRSQIPCADPSGQGSSVDDFPPPRADVNAPDLYLPLMAALTYIVICATAAGIMEVFTPELLGALATKTLIVLAVDVALVRLGFYLLSSSSTPILDCVALCGYGLVGTAINEFAWLLFGRWGVYLFMAYTAATFALFLIRTLRPLLLADPTPAGPVDYSSQGPSYAGSQPIDYGGFAPETEDKTLREQRLRNAFLFGIGAAQFAFMFFLAYIPKKLPKTPNV